MNVKALALFTPRWLPLIVAMTILAGLASDCGSRTVPTSKSPSPSIGFAATALVLVTTLHSGPGVTGNPAVASEGACAGSATVTIDPTPRGALRLAVAHFEISIIGCPPGTTITSVHIHQLPIGDRNDEWIGSDLPEVVLAKGDGSFTSTNQGVPIARAQEVIARPTDFYLHFHSKNNPVGFLRGELRPR